MNTRSKIGVPILILLLGMIAVLIWGIRRPPVLEISPAVPVFNFDQAVLNCAITNKSLLPIKILEPFLSQTFTINVLGPDGNKIPLGMMQDRQWDKTGVIFLGRGQTHEFSVDLLESSMEGIKFSEPRKDAPPERVAEYKQMVKEAKSRKLFGITLPGTYKVQAEYWVARDFKEHPEIGKGLWIGEMRSNQIEIHFLSREAGR